ncbi:hypothetical protein JCM11251_005492 [Rhodosporidiobolus azoricus]
MSSSILCFPHLLLALRVLLPLLSVLSITSASPLILPAPLATPSLTSGDFPHVFPRAASSSLSCSTTSECTSGGFEIPRNAHYLCLKKVGKCGWACNSGYTASGDTCIRLATSTTPTTAALRAPQTCSKTGDCANVVPKNANRFCANGVCSFRCRSGFTQSGESCAKPASSSSSTTFSSSKTAPPVLIATPSTICQVTADCSQEVPTGANRYCNKGICSWIPIATSSLSAALPSSDTTTYTSSASIWTTTTAVTATTTSTTTKTTATTASEYTWNNIPTRTFSTAPTPPAATPKLLRSYVGEDFFNPDKFWTFNYTDPTEGSVNYLRPPDLIARNLTSLPSPDVARLSVDSISSLSLGGNRDSVRISSVETVDPGSLVIADFAHIPSACGAWPAFWLYSDPWPENGEIDVLETVNLRNYNSMNIHTVSGCNRNPAAEMTGTWAYSASRLSYDAKVGSSCTAQDLGPDAVGTGFNEKGGGVFAVQIAETGISIWRWDRASIPADVLAGQPRPQTWGLPAALWDGSTYTNLPTYRLDSICGRMAGKTSTWRSSSGSGSCYPRYATCTDAAMDPAAFSEAYFDVRYIKVFSV